MEEDYSLAGMTRAMAEAKGRPLIEEELAEVKATHSVMCLLKAQIAAGEKHAALKKELAAAQEEQKAEARAGASSVYTSHLIDALRDEITRVEDLFAVEGRLVELNKELLAALERLTAAAVQKSLGATRSAWWHLWGKRARTLSDAELAEVKSEIASLREQIASEEELAALSENCVTAQRDMVEILRETCRFFAKLRDKGGLEHSETNYPRPPTTKQ